MATSNVNHGTAYQLNYQATFDGLCGTFGEPGDRQTTTQGSSSYLAGRLEGIVSHGAHLPARTLQAVAGALDAHEAWCDAVRESAAIRDALRPSWSR